MGPDNFPTQAIPLGPCHSPFTPLGKQKLSQEQAIPKFQDQWSMTPHLSRAQQACQPPTRSLTLPEVITLTPLE